MATVFVILFAIFVTVNCQRSPYAGSRPGSGYKDRFVPTQANPTDSQSTLNGNDLANRVGSETSSTGVPTRLPYDAYGDKFIVDHWNSLPVDQRPFWIVNQQHIENQRGTPPPQGSTVGNNLNTGASLADRLGGVTNQPSVNPNLISQQQEIVYPSNITPEQRIEMEINVLQNRLAALQRQREQLLANNQSQATQMNQQVQDAQNTLQQLQQQRGQRRNQQVGFF